MWFGCAMDSGRDSVDLLNKLLDRLGSRLDYVLVQTTSATTTSTCWMHPEKNSARSNYRRITRCVATSSQLKRASHATQY